MPRKKSGADPVALLAARMLLVPPGSRDALEPEQIAVLTNRSLIRRWHRCKAQISLVESGNSEPRFAPFLERATWEARRSRLQRLDRDLSAELMRRELVPATAKRSHRRSSPKPRPRLATKHRKQFPEIAKRRAIVQENLKMSALQACKRFDLEGIRMPTGWDAKNWVDAYKRKEYRSRIHTLISKDRHWSSR
jgi:hypothetical protein